MGEVSSRASLEQGHDQRGVPEPRAVGIEGNGLGCGNRDASREVEPVGLGLQSLPTHIWNPLEHEPPFWVEPHGMSRSVDSSHEPTNLRDLTPRMADGTSHRSEATG